MIGRGVEKLIQQIRANNRKTNILLISPIILGEKIGEEDYGHEYDEESIRTSKELKSVYQEIANTYNTDFWRHQMWQIPVTSIKNILMLRIIRS